MATSPHFRSGLAYALSIALSPYLTAPVIFIVPVVRRVPDWPSRLAYLGIMVGFGAVLPFLAILLAVRKGAVGDVHMADVAKRPQYLALSLAFVLVGLAVLIVSRAPALIPVYFACYALAIAAASIISRWYKISGHCMALGGIAAGLLFEVPLWAPAAAAALGLAAWARVARGRHTVAQCTLGGLCGFICVAGGVLLAGRILAL